MHSSKLKGIVRKFKRKGINIHITTEMNQDAMIASTTKEKDKLIVGMKGMIGATTTEGINSICNDPFLQEINSLRAMQFLRLDLFPMFR
jgi:hypothetical protein